MMNWGTKIWLLFIGLFLISAPNSNKALSQGSSTKSIEATIKISVCGNRIIENGEDCEGANLGGQTCLGLGYAGGTLACDISCSFDTLNCIALTPTPTPTPTPIPVRRSILPALVAIFDLDDSGRIEMRELSEVVKRWVEAWRNRKPVSDLNRDGECNLIDFSVLMYYIGR